MKKHVNTYLLLLLMAVTVVASAQIPTAKLSADSTRIEIGDHLRLTLTVKAPKTSAIVLPEARDTVSDVEFVRYGKSDTLFEGEEKIMTREYYVSAFDSGLFLVGLPVGVKDINGKNQMIYTNELIIEAYTLDVDTTQPFKPIKDILPVPLTFKEILPWLLAALGLCALLIIAFLLWKKYRKKKPIEPAKQKPKEPAHIWALAQLQKLDEEKLWQKDDVKQYYSRLTDILRMYLEYRYGMMAMECTTHEIERDLAAYTIDPKSNKLLLEVLKLADLVKFAKLNPLPDKHTLSMMQAKDFVSSTKEISSPENRQAKS